jgi:hypothetical protein
MEDKKTQKAQPSNQDIASLWRIPLENIKTHDAFSIKGRISGYWHVEKSPVVGLEINLMPQLVSIEVRAPGIKPIYVPMANIPHYGLKVDCDYQYKIEA